MNENEVIERLNEHLKARVMQNGSLNPRDKYFCIHYVEDFLDMTKEQAIQFLKDNIPMVMNL